MPTDDVTARARAEANRRHPHTGTLGVDTRRAARRLSFIAGAEWQHAHDAETIKALRAEVRQAQGHAERMQVYIAGMPYPSDLADAIRRAEAAEAEVATLRAKVEAVEALAARWVALAEAQGSAYKALFADTLRGNAGALRAALADPEMPRD